MKRIIIILFLLSTKLAIGQINNGSFEVWDTVYNNEYTNELDSVFHILNPMSGAVNNWKSGSQWGINRTTDNYSGTYSLILHNWYNYAKEWITYHDAIKFRPKSLQGYFKYITGGEDGLSNGNAIVTLTRFNGVSNDTIATGEYEFDSAAYFTPFQINFNYQSSMVPDSISIYFKNSNHNCRAHTMCNFLYLDDLSLSSETSDVENFEINELSFYPNPASGGINLHYSVETAGEVKIFLTDVLGKQTLLKSEYKFPGDYVESFDLRIYSQGIYNIVLKTGDKVNSGRIVVNR